MQLSVRTAGRAAAPFLLVPLLTSAVVLTVEVGTAPYSMAADGQDCAQVNDPTISKESPATEPSTPLQELQIGAAQDYVRQVLKREPGQGATVAVVDSGVVDIPGSLTPAQHGGPRAGKMLGSGRGTVVAGLVAGASAASPDDGDPLEIGIAPGATIQDVRVYDVDEQTSDDAEEPDAELLAQGLSGLVPQIKEGGRWVINVSLQVGRTPALDAAIADVTGAGAIVVAAAGDRDVVVAQSPDGGGAYRTGEDYADKVWPAGYAREFDGGTSGDSTTAANRRVLSVTTTGPADEAVTDYMVESSAIDLAVPTLGAVSYGANGVPCSIFTPSTRIAAAEVSGVLALLYSAFPGDTPEQLIARLLDTAAGSRAVDPAYPDRLVGRGIAQPLAAVTSLVTPDKGGRVERSTPIPETTGPVTLPVPEPDVLASTKSNAVWWGVFGGGALLLTVLLRPVLTRRRP